MNEISQAMASAVQSHQAGNLAEAERLCREVLARDPAHHPAMGLLGLVALQQGRVSVALEQLTRATSIAPSDAAYLTNLGVVHASMNQWNQAAECFRRAVTLNPNSADAQFNLGRVERIQGQLDRAAASFQRAVTCDPTRAEAHYNLGDVWKDLGQLEAAERCYREAVRLQPGHALANNSLGTVLHATGRLDEALACYERAVQFDPKLANAQNNLGVLRQAAGRVDEAKMCFEQALRIDPQLAVAHNNLGNAWKELGRFEDALNCFREVIRLKGKSGVVLSNLGNVLLAAGRFDEALAHYDEAIRLQPDYAEAHYNRAFVLLSRGDLKAGWAAYEWRTKCAEYAGPSFREPMWDGSDLAGRTLLVHAEQGIGDILQFIRYVPLVRRRGGRVLVQVLDELLPLLRASGYEDLFAQDGKLPAFDVQVPLMSLPRILGTTLATIPNEVPYLAADSKLVDAWGRRLASVDGFKVGIAWRGRPTFTFDRFRSIPLVALAPLANLPGVRLISLQKGLGSEEIAAATEQVPLVDLGVELDRDAGPFMDTAAVMKNLDLVITADTAIGHLAGALGVPVWLALTSVAEWRWMIDREDSPWYPTARLFRQSTFGDWAEVFGRMAAALGPLAGG